MVTALGASRGEPATRRHPEVAANGCPTPWYVRPFYDPADPGPIIGETIATPCRRYTCPACGRGRLIEARQLIAEGVRAGLVRGDEYRMVTVTWPAERGHEWGAEGLRSARVTWRRMVQHYRRSHTGAPIEYAITPERHKSGIVHLHAIVVGGRWLQKCSDGGRQAHGLPTGPGSGSPCYCDGVVSCRRGASCRYRADHERPCIQAIARTHGAGWVDISGPKARGGGHQAMMSAASYATKYILKSTLPVAPPSEPGVSGEAREIPDHWPRYARRISCSRRWGATLGQIHAAYVLRVKLDRPGDPRDPVGWMRVESPARRWAGTEIDLPPPVGVDARTGELSPELLPTPF